MRLEEKDVLIFDVDGTLYNQRKMRLYMGVQLILYYIGHIKEVKYLYGLYIFRKYREKNRTIDIDSSINNVAAICNTEAFELKRVVDYWMFERPIEVINRFIYKDLIRYIATSDKKIVIYSDYPCIDKINRIGIDAYITFNANQIEINEQKPSRKAMTYIMKQLSVDENKILYVGDRDDKDGVSAKYANIDYCDIKVFLKLLKTKRI